MQFAVCFIIQKGSKILRFNSPDVDTLVMQLPDEVKDAVTDSVNWHTKLVCIAFAVFDFFLMDVRIEQIRDLLSTVKLAGGYAQVNSVAERGA